MATAIQAAAWRRAVGKWRLARRRVRGAYRPRLRREPSISAGRRVTGMAEIAMDAHAISASQRYNRPQSVAEEQEVLDVVRKQLEWERTYDEAMRTGT